jgi:hypothetical protein
MSLLQAVLLVLVSVAGSSLVVVALARLLASAFGRRWR